MSEAPVKTSGGTEVDARLRDALRDDLPPGVERRLARRFDLERERRRAAAGTNVLERFLAELAARTIVPAQLASPAALVLLLSGTLLQTLGPGSAAAGSVLGLNAVASVSEAIRVAGPLLCAGRPGAESLSPEALSRRVYRSWVLVGSGVGERLVFRALDESALYEVEVDPGTYRPKRFRRLAGAGSPRRDGEMEECEWPASPAGVGVTGEGRSR